MRALDALLVVRAVSEMLPTEQDPDLLQRKRRIGGHLWAVRQL